MALWADSTAGAHATPHTSILARMVDTCMHKGQHSKQLFSSAAIVLAASSLTVAQSVVLLTDGKAIAVIFCQERDGEQAKLHTPSVRAAVLPGGSCCPLAHLHLQLDCLLCHTPSAGQLAMQQAGQLQALLQLLLQALQGLQTLTAPSLPQMKVHSQETESDCTPFSITCQAGLEINIAGALQYTVYKPQICPTHCTASLQSAPQDKPGTVRHSSPLPHPYTQP